METSVSVAVFTGDFISRVPHLVAWTVAIILAVVMVKRGGGEAEKLFLAGSGLMLISTLASPLLKELSTWLVTEQGMSRAAASGWFMSLPLGILTVASFGCLVSAFWMRFMTKEEGQENPAKEVLE